MLCAENVSQKLSLCVIRLFELPSQCLHLTLIGPPKITRTRKLGNLCKLPSTIPDPSYLRGPPVSTWGYQMLENSFEPIELSSLQN